VPWRDAMEEDYLQQVIKVTFLILTYRKEHLSQSMARPTSETVKRTTSAFKCSTIDGRSLKKILQPV
jgi:hypothetical protein